MKEVGWNGWESFISKIISLGKPDPDTINLFRGQSCFKPLLPAIARLDPTVDTTDLERNMLGELRIRGGRFLEQDAIKDIDLLAIAQHHGMATGLLDWSTNALVAIWFACIGNDNNANGHFYFYRTYQDSIFNPQLDLDPLSLTSTKIFRPNSNNPRVIAQHGWFSVHHYRPSTNANGTISGNFVGLESDILHFLSIYHFEIPSDEKPRILENLNYLGVNFEYLFPDVDGLCKNINKNNGY